MKLYLSPSIIIKDKFKYHDEIKDNLTNLIKKSKNKSRIKKDDYYEDNISKLDWEDSEDPEREWVKTYIEKFGEALSHYAGCLGYSKIHLQRIWYQEYNTDATHGWHIHSGNYTGAYYLKLPKDAPYTEFIENPGHTKSYTIKVKEGDLLFFPSHFMHRSPKNKSLENKIIISWNLSFDGINPEYVHSQKKLLIIE